MITETSIHNVKKVIIEETQDYDNFQCRRIRIFCGKVDDAIEIILFSKEDQVKYIQVSNDTIKHRR